MRKFLLTILFTVFSCFSFANDWEFGSNGEHIIPLKGSSVAIKKEKITLKLDRNGMFVNVKFTFDSPIDEKKIIGFVAPESGKEGMIEDIPKNKRRPEPLLIKNFKTTVNGIEVKSNIDLLSRLLSKGVLEKNAVTEYLEDEKFVYNYVYYFNADFKKGENTVEHSYFYSGSRGVLANDFYYVVTTISKWQNKRVEDFEIEVHPGNYFVDLPYSFWKDNKKINWEVVGDGKILITDPVQPSKNSPYPELYENEGAIFLRLKNGFVRYRTKNFSPDKDFSLTSIDNIKSFISTLPSWKYKNYILKDGYFDIINLGDSIEENDLKNLSDFELDILRNYPFAFAGYDFDRADLKNYFSKFVWYIPLTKNVKLTTSDKEIVNIIKNFQTKKKK